jgi:hypothetical protein
MLCLKNAIAIDTKNPVLGAICFASKPNADPIANP